MERFQHREPHGMVLIVALPFLSCSFWPAICPHKLQYPHVRYGGVGSNKVLLGLNINAELTTK